ncbi:MAG: ATP-binding protein [Actinomycetota bacterium]
MAEKLCANCGTPLPAEASFCPSCGAPVGEPDAADERKVVTVLFADVAGSTELAASLDPERLREVMGEFYRAASEELVSLRGRAEKFVGDAVMAVFGLPYAHDDDALRAVRAGLQIRDRAERLGERLGTPLRVRVGINTGPVAAAAAPAGEFMVSGAEVNVAARLQQAAEPGEILVGDTTWQLTRHAAEFGDPRRVEARGFAQPITARPVRAISPRSSRRTIPLVGRRRELDLLVGAAERAWETRRAHLVTLVGEPGIGKSRLVQELLAAVPEHAEVLQGRASEFGEDPTFAPLAEMVRRRLGVEGDAPADVLRKELEGFVAGCCDASEADQVAARLGLLLGLGEENRQSTPYRAAEIRAGLLSLVGGLARSGPVVVALEDLHLGRPPLLDLLEELARGARRMPLAVVAVAREELLRQRPGWGAGVPDSLVLRLEQLSFAEAGELASAAAGQPLDEGAAEMIARHAGGNPFFIVEITGMLLHEREEHDLRRPAAEHLLPPTVQAVVASRIDHLSEPARRLIRVASLFPGGAFHESKLALVADVDPHVLRTLEEEELIVRDDDERPGRWRFRHELLREVAYESVSKRERRRLHEALAAGVQEMDATQKHAQQVAYHLEEAAVAALDLDPTDREPARRAETALERAGDIARRRMESRAAIDLYERALSLIPREGWGSQEARILSSAGEARYWLGDYEQAQRQVELALEIGGDDPWVPAHGLRFLADIVLNVRGDVDRAEDLFDRAVAAARDSGDPRTVARTLLMAGWVPYWRNELDPARAMFEEALGLARGEGDLWAEARAVNSLVSVVSPASDALEALGLSEQALAIGREMGDAFSIAVAQENVGTSLRRLFRLDEALPHLSQAVGTFRDLGARWELASAVGERGGVHRLAGRLPEAEADLREALELCRELGERALVTWTVAELATVLLARNDRDGARRLLDELSSEEMEPEPGSRTSVIRTEALLALAEGDEAGARRLADEALAAEQRDGIPNWGAANVWWTGRIFGPEAAGGPERVNEARARLEAVHWEAALREPDLALAMVSGG